MRKILALGNRQWLTRIMADLIYSGVKSAAFGGALGLAAVFFASGIPRVKIDVLQVGLCRLKYSVYTNLKKGLPLIGGYFIKEIHPADNVSYLRRYTWRRPFADILSPSKFFRLDGGMFGGSVSERMLV